MPVNISYTRHSGFADFNRSVRNTPEKPRLFTCAAPNRGVRAAVLPPLHLPRFAAAAFAANHMDVIVKSVLRSRFTVFTVS